MQLAFLKIKSIFCLLLLLIATAPAMAQSASDERKVFIDLNTGFSVTENSFTETWDAYPALRLNLRLPFYAGRIEGGLRYTRFEGHAPTSTDSDFRSIYIYLGYSYPFKITSRYSISPTLHFGNNLMIFDESEVFTNQSSTERYATDQTESELTYELALRNQFQIFDRWYLHAVLSYNRTFTYYPLSVTFFSIGISYSFPQPGWLKNIIK